MTFRKNMRAGLFKFIGLTCVLFFISCNKNDEEFRLGSQFLESQSNVMLIDTFAVEMSTVIIDSFATSGLSSALVGTFQDTIFGKVDCRSFFRIGLPVANNILENDVYDSVKLILKHSGYSYGDTTVPFTINVNRVIDDIEAYDDGYIYSTSSFPIEETPIGSYTYNPRPNFMDSVEVPIDDNIGKELYDMIYEKDEIVSTEQMFRYYYLKGLALTAPGAKTILKYTASSGNIKIRLYYHRYVNNEKVDLAMDFPMTNPELQFNQIKHDFSGSEYGLQSLKNRRDAIVSSKTGDFSFLYGGVGLLLKIRFPSMSDFLLVKNRFILSAQLELRPKAGTYRNYTLPSVLMTYRTDYSNTFGSIFYNYDGSIKQPTLVVDNEFNEGTVYKFDVSDYIKDELSDSYFDTDQGLLICTLPDYFTDKFDRIIFEGDRAPVLKLYVVNY